MYLLQVKETCQIYETWPHRCKAPKNPQLLWSCKRWDAQKIEKTNKQEKPDEQKKEEETSLTATCVGLV